MYRAYAQNFPFRVPSFNLVDEADKLNDETYNQWGVKPQRK
jgi:hypothetical protein